MDAVTTAAVINAARALMISSLMKSLLLGYQFTSMGYVVTVFVTFGFVSLTNDAHSNTNA